MSKVKFAQYFKSFFIKENITNYIHECKKSFRQYGIYLSGEHMDSERSTLTHKIYGNNII